MLKFNDESLKIFALGGLEEVGKNCYVLEKNNEIIVVDAGIKFLSGDNYSLAKAIIPNFDYLKENKERIKGIFVTHGHEDHIGAIPSLLDVVGNVTVYGSNFSIELLKQKMKGRSSKFVYSIFTDETVVGTAEFIVRFFRVTHSIPGSFGLVIETRNDTLRVLMTGDFKFDWSGNGEKTDLSKIAEFGKKGVDILLSDSTNSEIAGTTVSELKVVNRLEAIISQAPARVIITSFASNVYRLKKVIEIANKLNKKIVLLGSSLMRAMEAIKKASLWKIDGSVFIDVERMKSFKREDLIIFCTGSQGEEKAVLSRLANQNHSDFKITKNDCVILTSSPIVDNVYNLEAINDKLHHLGALVYENSKEETLHASGHASQEDLKLMLTLVNPRYFMPFHGDYRMLKRHGMLAQETGVPEENVLICKNGDVVSSFVSKEKKGFAITGKSLYKEPDYVFNKEIIPGDIWKKNILERNKMFNNGVLIVLLFFKKLVGKKPFFQMPHIFTYGFINVQRNKEVIRDWKILVQKKINEDNYRNFEKKRLEELVSSTLRNSISKTFKGKEPLISIIFEEE